MKLANKKLFDVSELINYVSKFEKKVMSCTKSIEQLKADIDKLDMEINTLIEKDIMSDTDEYKKDLSNARAKRANLVTMHEEEVSKLNKIVEIMKQGVNKIIPELKNRLNQDLSVYLYEVERYIYNQLKEIRETQAELLLTLVAARHIVLDELWDYDTVCEELGLAQYKKGLTLGSFHNNMFYPNRNFPELGAPLLNIGTVTATEEIVFRAWAEANAIYNRDKSPEESEQLPQSMKLSDVNIEKYLSKIKVD